MPEKITYVCMTQNRINNVKRNIPRVIDYVDELVIVDGFSVDGTKEWLEAYSPKIKVVQRQWDDSFARQYNRYLQEIKEGWIFICYDKDTEVLTNSGWKFFKDLDKTEEILTMNPADRTLEFQKPSKYISYKYSGDMYDYIGKSCSFGVTSKHNMFYSPNNNYESQFRLMPIEDVVKNKKARFLSGGDWHGITYDGEIVSGIDNYTLMKILGWYISEGWCYKQDFRHKIYISQVKEDNRKIICDLIESIGSSPIKDGDHTFVFYHKELFNFLSQFGRKSYDKHLTREIMDLDCELLSTFLDSYLLGDGTKNGHRGHTFCTVSKNLADNIQEICIKLGYRSVLKMNPPRDGGINKDGKRIIGTVPIYSGTINNHPENTIVTGDIKKITYNDFVYCVTVPNHIICVRRNGRPMFCGNCDDDELPSEELCKCLRSVVDDSDNGTKYDIVEFRVNDIQIDSLGKIIRNPGPTEYYRQLLHRYNPGMHYAIDLHQNLRGHKYHRGTRRKEVYYHIKSIEDEVRNSCRNWWIAGVWDDSINAGVQPPEWHELRRLFISSYPNVSIFSDVNSIMVKGNMDQSIKDYLLNKVPLLVDEPPSRKFWELKQFTRYYFEILHPEEKK